MSSPLIIPELSLVVLCGPSGSGKSTFAARHFLPTEVLSSDRCRGLVSDDDNDLSATNAAFEALHFIASKRLAWGRLTVVDATNTQPEARKPLVELARTYHCLPVAIVFDLPPKLCGERNRTRPDRDFGPHVIRRQRQELHRNLRGLRWEGFRHIYIFKSVEEVDAAGIVRQKLWNNRRDEHGPFDVIGDVHGCIEELSELLGLLGYRSLGEGAAPMHPEGRRVIFLGDLVDRGPGIAAVLRLAMSMVEAESALCVPGNHDIKLMRALRGKDVKIAHGLQESLDQLGRESEEFRARVADFLDGLVSHYVFDDGRLVAAHAGMKEEMAGRGSGRVRDFALFGETTGETDEFGLPVRYPWAAEYRGSARVVYGHTPVLEPEWLNRTINIDTGCVFGGKLTALRYPEMELVSVASRRVYAEPAKPLEAPSGVATLSLQQAQDDVLDIEDVLGKRIIHTRLAGHVTIREENAAAALEVVSRFAVDPKWLVYLPPTMSPCATSEVEGLLEHPREALAYYATNGVVRAVCEEKHMGSRAVVVVCRDAEAARARFGVTGGEAGVVYTRTGRRFFNDGEMEAQLLSRVREAAGASGLWEELSTDWLCLDCELMPWSLKAQELLRQQYAAVGCAAEAALAETGPLLLAARARGLEVEALAEYLAGRHECARAFSAAYRRYVWSVGSLDDVRLAPFHLLAAEGKVFTDRDHAWHMDTLARMCAADGPVLLATPYRVVDLSDEANIEEATAWWEELTARGGEGMVVKPLDFVVKGGRGLLQPAVKCRGREYLRIIYGPEYTAPENLVRLRERGLGHKRALALREFALGLEALERFVAREPLRRVHECVFGVLALESEPVDPRL